MQGCESSCVSWPLIAMGKFKNVQLDGELKTSGLQLLFFVFLFSFFPPKRSRQQPLFTLSLIYYSLFLISPIFAGQLRVGGEEGRRKKKINDWTSGNAEFLFGSEQLMVIRGNRTNTGQIGTAYRETGEQTLQGESKIMQLWKLSPLACCWVAGEWWLGRTEHFKNL